MAGRDVTPIQTQFERVTDALDLLDQMLADCSTATELIDASTSAAELLDRMKIVSSSIDGKLRALAASGPVFTETGTLRLGEEPKRKMRPQGKVLVRRRIADLAKARSQGELSEALILAIELTERAYASPSTNPKWGVLQELGFHSWDEVADTETVVKGAVFEPRKEGK